MEAAAFERAAAGAVAVRLVVAVAEEATMVAARVVAATVEASGPPLDGISRHCERA